MEIMSTTYAWGNLIALIIFFAFLLTVAVISLIVNIASEGFSSGAVASLGMMAVPIIGFVVCLCLSKDCFTTNKVKVTDPVCIEECVRCGNIEFMEIDDGCMYAEMSNAQLKKVKDNVFQKSMYASLQREKEQSQGEQQYSR